MTSAKRVTPQATTRALMCVRECSIGHVPFWIFYVPRRERVRVRVAHFTCAYSGHLSPVHLWLYSRSPGEPPLCPKYIYMEWEIVSQLFPRLVACIWVLFVHMRCVHDIMQNGPGVWRAFLEGLTPTCCAVDDTYHIFNSICHCCSIAFIHESTSVSLLPGRICRPFVGRRPENAAEQEGCAVEPVELPEPLHTYHRYIGQLTSEHRSHGAIPHPPVIPDHIIFTPGGDPNLPLTATDSRLGASSGYRDICCLTVTHDPRLAAFLVGTLTLYSTLTLRMARGFQIRTRKNPPRTRTREKSKECWMRKKECRYI